MRVFDCHYPLNFSIQASSFLGIMAPVLQTLVTLAIRILLRRLLLR
jgi:hypothetical protein